MSMTHADLREYDRNLWKNWDDAALFKELSALRKATFDRLFGHIARHSFNNLVEVLQERGHTHQPNIFGDIPLEKMKID